MSIEIASIEHGGKTLSINDLGAASEARSTTGPTLSGLGKRIEMLRIERGLPKQLLARRAGASRQQLWRVMTGKSELTSTLCARLAEALQVEPATLTADAVASIPLPLATSLGSIADTRTFASAMPPAPPMALSDYVADLTSVERTLRTLPTGPDGTRLKRALMNELEDASRGAGLRLGPRFFALRRRVLNGEI